MTRHYMSCADTAKLVRKSLKEAFPDVVFGVRSKTYSGGASITVDWEDGPNCEQVEAVAKRFCGAYFDGSIDYKGSVYHMIDGQPVSFGADFIHCTRSYSDAAVLAAIQRVCRRFADTFEAKGLECPTVEEYRRGRLWSLMLCNADSVQSEINRTLHRHSDRLRGRDSATAGRVFVTHDDGYSRQVGDGFSAVSVDSFVTPTPGDTK